MLTYQSFVISFAVSSIINQRVQVLSQLIIKGLFSLNIITLSNLLIKIASFAIYNRANNLASMLNVVTISYLFTLQAISPLNGFIIYSYKLFLLTELYKGYYCDHLRLPLGQAPDTPQTSIGYVLEVRTRSIQSPRSQRPYLLKDLSLLLIYLILIKIGRASCRERV